jgi:hypothetical protein
MSIEGAQIDAAHLLARGAWSDGGADRGVEPPRTAARLSSIPDRDDLVGLGNGLPFGFGAFGFLSGSGCGPIPFLRLAVLSDKITAGRSTLLSKLMMACRLLPICFLRLNQEATYLISG